MTRPQLFIEQRQHQTLSPRLQRAVRLLQLSSLDFAHELQALVGRNPFLENDGELPGEADGDTGAPEAADDASDEAQPALDLLGGGTESPSEHELWSADGSSAPRAERTGDGNGMESIASTSSLSAHLHAQLNVLRLPWRDLALARAIVESLDEDGYLRTDLDDIGPLAGLEPEADADELRIALCRVQALDPVGVGARSLPECLLLQLPRIPCPQERRLAERVLSGHIDALAARDLAALAAALHVPEARVASACRSIRGFDPRPGLRFGGGRIEYVTPDVIVRKRDGKWQATLNRGIVPRLRLNQIYADLFQRHRSAQHTELASQLQEARWALHNVEQRFSTILSVTRAIIERQHHFLDYGPMAMKPLGLREIARAVGVHESTVCRVTNNKYMATPTGTFELKHFFSRGLEATSGSRFSPTAVKGLVRDMIQGENPQAPLSDAEIARELERQGLPMARRTVTKYRQGMRIEVAGRRHTI